MTNPENFHRVGNAQFNNYAVNDFANRMSNVIAWNCNPEDPTSYYWDKVIVDDLSDSHRIIDYTNATARRDDVMFIPNIEKSSASTTITPVNQQVKCNFNFSDNNTNTRICSEETIGNSRTKSALRGYNVESTQYPSITSSEHEDNDSMTAIHSTMKENMLSHQLTGYDSSQPSALARKTICSRCSNVMTLYID